MIPTIYYNPGTRVQHSKFPEDVGVVVAVSKVNGMYNHSVLWDGLSTPTPVFYLTSELRRGL